MLRIDTLSYRIGPRLLLDGASATACVGIVCPDIEWPGIEWPGIEWPGIGLCATANPAATRMAPATTSGVSTFMGNSFCLCLSSL